MKKIIALLLVALLLCGCTAKKEENLAIPGESVSNEKQEEKETTGENAGENVGENEGEKDPDEIPEGEEAIGGPSEKENYVNRLIRVSSQNAEGAEEWYREYVYDAQGNVLEETEYNGQGDVNYRTENTYDENGFLVRSDVYGSEILNYSIVYQRNELGQVTRQETWEEEFLLDCNEYTYDEKGSILSNRVIYEEEVQEYTFEYTYDEKGNVVSRKEYQDGQLITYEEMTYDTEGRLTASSYYQADGTLTSATESTWEGTTETKTLLDGDGNAYMVSVINYDQEGNILMQENQQDGQILSLVEYIYDDLPQA